MSLSRTHLHDNITTTTKLNRRLRNRKNYIYIKKKSLHTSSSGSFLLISGTFTIKFKREFILCCYCLQQQWRRRRGASGENGTYRTALLYTHRSMQRSSDSSSSFHADRVCRTLSPRSNDATAGNFSLPSSSSSPYTCRIAMYPTGGGGGGGGGSGGGLAGSDVSTECSRMSLNSIGREPPPHRANINNFARIGSCEY